DRRGQQGRDRRRVEGRDRQGGRRDFRPHRGIGTAHRRDPPVRRRRRPDRGRGCGRRTGSRLWRTTRPGHVVGRRRRPHQGSRAMIARLTVAAPALTVGALTASPVFAASGPFFSLRNTDFIVTLAFLLFVGILLYFRVPAAI